MKTPNSIENSTGLYVLCPPVAIEPITLFYRYEGLMETDVFSFNRLKIDLYLKLKFYFQSARNEKVFSFLFYFLSQCSQDLYLKLKFYFQSAKNEKVFSFLFYFLSQCSNEFI